MTSHQYMHMERTKEKGEAEGFTLLETIMYIGLCSILMTGVFVSAYGLVDTGTRTRTHIALQEEGTFINRKLNWALSGASALSLPDPTTLIITRPDLGAQSPLSFTYDAGQFFLARGNSAKVSLTTDEFSVSNVHMQVIHTNGDLPDALRITYTIHDMPFVFTTYVHF